MKLLLAILRTIFACYATKAMLRKLDADDFRSIAAVDYILFNPDDAPDCARQMFLELPVESGPTVLDKGGSILLVRNFYARFSPICVPKQVEYVRNNQSGAIGIERCREVSSTTVCRMSFRSR